MKNKITVILFSCIWLFFILFFFISNKIYLFDLIKSGYSEVVSLLGIALCLALGWVSYAKRKEKYQLVLMLIASVLAFVYVGIV